jgi:serine phosphatase RsbU (regulator of sigma subunit)
LAQEIPIDVEEAISDQMVAQAVILAHFIGAAEQAGLSPEEINARLREIVDQSTLDELWITDEVGFAYLHSLESVEFTFSPDPDEQPQASRFWPLLTGEEDVVVQEARVREIDDRVFKYVGVGGVDQSRIVEVGFEATYLDALADRVGLPRAVDNLLGGGDIDALFVLNESLDTVSSATVLGADVNAAPDEAEMDVVRSVLRTGEAQSILAGGVLSVMAPMVAQDGTSVGVAVVRLPTDRLQDTLGTLLRTALIIALGIVLVGAAVSIWMARREAAPVLVMKTAKERMEGELNVAADIQMSMLPLDFPAFPDRGEFSVYATLEPAREVGGDFYDFFLIDDDHLCFCIADVSDKGVPAALFMAVTKTLIKSHAAANLSPASIVTAANEELCEDNESSMFVTIFLCILNIQTGHLTYTNAGHNPPYIKTSRGDLVILDERHGPVAGAVGGVAYDEDDRQLDPGDYVILFTDGVTEAMNSSHELYSEEALESLLEETRLESSEQATGLIFESVRDHAGSAEQSDDITVLTLEFVGAPVTSSV